MSAPIGEDTVCGQKRALRARFREIRAGMPQADRERAERAILEKLFCHPWFRAADTVLAYAAMPGEIQTLPLLTRCLEDGKVPGLPVCDTASKEMIFYKISALRQLRPGAYGIPEPPACLENALMPSRTSLCVVPMWGFDKFGYRLGAGGGYYDRYLAKFHVRTIGLCFSCCGVERLPRENTDIPLDLVLTEEEENVKIETKSAR